MEMENGSMSMVDKTEVDMGLGEAFKDIVWAYTCDVYYNVYYNVHEKRVATRKIEKQYTGIVV